MYVEPTCQHRDALMNNDMTMLEEDNMKEEDYHVCGVARNNPLGSSSSRMKCPMGCCCTPY